MESQNEQLNQDENQFCPRNFWKLSSHQLNKLTWIYESWILITKYIVCFDLLKTNFRQKICPYKCSTLWRKTNSFAWKKIRICRFKISCFIWWTKLVFCYQNCSSDREKILNRGWRPRICKIFEITGTIYSKVFLYHYNNFFSQ